MNTKSLVLAGCAIAVVSALLLFHFAFWNSTQNGNSVHVYFFNEQEGRLQPVRLAVPDVWQATGNALFMQAAFNLIFTEPPSSSLTRPWPDLHEMSFIQYFLYEQTMVVEFGEYYNEVEPLLEALFRSALTLTMTGLPFIETVEVRIVDGYAVRIKEETIATIANAPMISPALQSDQTFTLFFIDESGDGLIFKSYVAPAVNLHFRNQAILERLIENQNAEGVHPSIPPETRVLSVHEHRDAFAIYVNLSSDFFTRFGGGPSEARLMIASIANTLIENAAVPQLRRVYFFIESDRRSDFHGVADFDLGFSFDETIVIGFTPEVVVPEFPEGYLPIFDDDLD